MDGTNFRCHAACNVLWPPGDAQDAVKHAAAMILLGQPGHACDIGRLGSMLSGHLKVKSVKRMLRSAGYDSKVKELLVEDPAFTWCRHDTVCLDVPYVLAYADISVNQPPAAIMPPMPHAAPFYAPPAFPPMGMGMGLPAASPFVPAAAAGILQAAGAFLEDRNPYNPQVQQAAQQHQHQQQLEQQQQQQMQHQQQQQQQQMYASQAAAAAAAVQGPAPFPEVFEMHAQQEDDGSYTMYLSEISEQDGSNGCGAGSNGSNGRRKVRAVRGRRASRGSASTEDDGSGDDLNSLLELLPPNKRLMQELAPYTQPGSEPFLVDLAADLGRPISLRLSDKSCIELPLTLDLDGALARLQEAVTGDVQPATAAAKRTTHGAARRCSNQSAAAAAGGKGGNGTVSSPGGRRCSFFSDTNRLGVPGSLHRISAMRDRNGAVYGLTYRVGRHVPGVADLLSDVLSSMRDAARGLDSSGGSSLVPSIASQPSKGLLLLGRPGVGKTTLLRDVARLMSLPESQGGLGMSVVIVDTSNEIAGDCEQPHPCIGNARRMMVPRRHQQASVMIEAVMNHTPEVIIVDEIATKEEAAACRTIAARGVLLVSTAHGSSLGDLLRNPDLQGLVGGVKAVTLGDKLANADNRGQKTRLERGGAVTFGSLVEILGTNKWRLHPDVAASVDCLLSHSHASGSSSTTDLDLAPHTPPGVDTQLRSRSAAPTAAGTKGLLVSFEAGRVPTSAAWFAGWEPPAEWSGQQAQGGMMMQRPQQQLQLQQHHQQQQGYMGGMGQQQQQLCYIGGMGQQQYQQQQQQQRVGGKRTWGGYMEQGAYQQDYQQQQQQQPRKKAKILGSVKQSKMQKRLDKQIKKQQQQQQHQQQQHQQGWGGPHGMMTRSRNMTWHQH